MNAALTSTVVDTPAPALGLTEGGSWFRQAGLGVFVHWDHASQQGIEVSWPLVWGNDRVAGQVVRDGISVADYHASAATFDPHEWDAVALAAAIKSAGATYAVFTARHHAGYAMFHSIHSDFGIEHSAFGRDVTGEFIEAIRAQGIRVGLYFSLSDWHHPDYPAFTDADRPYAHAGYQRATPEAWARYQAYLRGQLTEVLTNYGTIDLLWFDGEWERTEQEWDTAGLRAMIKSLQPDVVINNRLLGQGDYVTPEQGLPRHAPEGPWELCLTIGQVWQYNPADTTVKSPRSLASTLCEVVSRGGNLLLNVGPTGTGAIPVQQLTTLETLGGWVDDHREALVGAAPAPDVDFYGPVTTSDGAVYLHLLSLPVEQVAARGLPVGRVSRVTLLATGEELAFTTHVEVHESFMNGGEPLGQVSIDAPGPSGALIDIVKIELTP